MPLSWQWTQILIKIGWACSELRPTSQMCYPEPAPFLKIGVPSIFTYSSNWLLAYVTIKQLYMKHWYKHEQMCLNSLTNPFNFNQCQRHPLQCIRRQLITVKHITFIKLARRLSILILLCSQMTASCSKMLEYTIEKKKTATTQAEPYITGCKDTSAAFGHFVSLISRVNSKQPPCI